MPVILVAGGPRTGKTTFAAGLADRLGYHIRHTDDLIKTHEWSAASLEASRWIDERLPMTGGVIIEGVAVVRAVRKWLARHPTGKPCDRFYWAGRPKVALTSGQATMFSGCRKVLAEILPELRKRGVNVEEVT